MRVVAVESSTLAAVGYESSGGLLRLEFSSRAVYHYFGVPGAVHRALLSAPSKGIFFNQSIRGRFPYRRVSEQTQLSEQTQQRMAALEGRE